MAVGVIDIIGTLLEGGTVAGWRTADYLFSEDATCPDTERVFESKDYLWNKVTVFQSLFLSTCEKRQSVKSVCVGHYVLPPASVQDGEDPRASGDPEAPEVRNVVGRLIWERDDEQSVAVGSQKSFSCPSEDEYSRSLCESSDTDSSGHLQQYPVTNTHQLTGYVSMSNLQQYPGDLRDFHPGCFRCSNCEADTSAAVH